MTTLASIIPAQAVTMPKDNNGEYFEFQSIQGLVASSQPIDEPRTQAPGSVWFGNPYGVIGQLRLANNHTEYPGSQLAVPKHGMTVTTPVAISNDLWKPAATGTQAQSDWSPETSTTSVNLMPVFGSMPPSPYEPSLHGNPAMAQINGTISTLTPSPTLQLGNSIRQQPITFPLTPPVTAKYRQVVPAAKLSTIAECDTEDERTPRSCRKSRMRGFDLTLTPTPTPTPTTTKTILEEEKKVKIVHFQDQDQAT